MHYSSVLCSPHRTSSKAADNLSNNPIASALQTVRSQTLTFAVNLGDRKDLVCQQAHPDFSPIGWHLGHIAFTESLWIAEQLAGETALFPEYRQLFSADGLPKAQRQNLPALADLLEYLAKVRDRTLAYLSAQPDPTGKTLRLWHWLIQHESQHVETMAMVLAMHQQQQNKAPFSPQQLSYPKSNACEPPASELSEMALVAAGDFIQGAEGPNAIDNERPAQRKWLDDYWIDRSPVTCGQFHLFVAAGGYDTAKWWCKEGWQWQQKNRLNRPLYWRDGWHETPEFGKYENVPVCGVSWYEASAYANFVGKRLPSEAEWEKAMGSGLRLPWGQVWEWTDTWFKSYSGFEGFPYEGYSQLYFDGAHRVLKGSSWATQQWTRRRSFRNWYHPWRREMFAGFRCAC